jgi:NAD(P)-dependent dehydrogenase (short-subunit alcohol dehydrogenase family)
MSENHKKIWVTGASSGIGKAVAEKFAKEGWKVAVSARRKEILDQMSNDQNIYSFPLDVTNENNCKSTFEKIIQKFNGLDICLFCSGTYDPKKEHAINLTQSKFIMDVNYFGTLNCVKSVEMYFKKKKNGHISIVSSIAGYRGLPNSSGYGPSKAALTNFAESIYFEFKKFNVRVSIISPGFIKTPLTDKNEFPMPFLRSPEFAAKKIFKGLVKSKSFEIDFPKQLTFILKFLRILPYKIYLILVDKLVKR